MRTSRLLILTFSIFCSWVIIHAQVPAGSRARTTPSEAERTDVRLEILITRAEDHFRKGQLDLVEGKREKARDEFDKAIDVILESGLDVRASVRLQTFYLDLVERVYRAEVPSIPVSLLSNVAVIAQNTNSQLPSKNRTLSEAQPKIGFREQQVELTPLDSLSKLIMPEEHPKAEASRPACNAQALRRINLRGLRLGMTVTEVKIHLPGLKIDAMNEFGVREVTFASARFKSPRIQHLKIPALRGIQMAFLKFLDSRVTEIYIAYDNSVEWSSADEFAAIVSKRLDLHDVPMKTGHLRVIRCGTIAFIVGLESIDGRRLPTVLLYDRSGEENISKRIKASAERQRAIKARLEEKKKTTFKP